MKRIAKRNKHIFQCLINYSMNFSYSRCSLIARSAESAAEKFLCNLEIHKICLRYSRMLHQPSEAEEIKYGKSTYFPHLHRERLCVRNTVFSSQLNTNGFRQNGFVLIRSWMERKRWMS